MAGRHAEATGRRGRGRRKNTFERSDAGLLQKSDGSDSRPLFGHCHSRDRDIIPVAGTPGPSVKALTILSPPAGWCDKHHFLIDRGMSAEFLFFFLLLFSRRTARISAPVTVEFEIKGCNWL